MQPYQKVKLTGEIFKKTDFVEHCRTKKNCIHQSYSQENTGDGVLFSAVADMWAYSFSKRDSITDTFL